MKFLIDIKEMKYKKSMMKHLEILIDFNKEEIRTHSLFLNYLEREHSDNKEAIEYRKFLIDYCSDEIAEAEIFIQKLNK